MTYKTFNDLTINDVVCFEKYNAFLRDMGLPVEPECEFRTYYKITDIEVADDDASFTLKIVPLTLDEYYNMRSAVPHLVKNTVESKSNESTTKFKGIDVDGSNYNLMIMDVVSYPSIHYFVSIIQGYAVPTWEYKGLTDEQWDAYHTPGNFWYHYNAMEKFRTNYIFNSTEELEGYLEFCQRTKPKKIEKIRFHCPSNTPVEFVVDN